MLPGDIREIEDALRERAGSLPLHPQSARARIRAEIERRRRRRPLALAAGVAVAAAVVAAVVVVAPRPAPDEVATGPVVTTTTVAGPVTTAPVTTTSRPLGRPTGTTRPARVPGAGPGTTTRRPPATDRETRRETTTTGAPVSFKIEPPYITALVPAPAGGSIRLEGRGCRPRAGRVEVGFSDFGSGPPDFSSSAPLDTSAPPSVRWHVRVGVPASATPGSYMAWARCGSDGPWTEQGWQDVVTG